MLLHETAVKGDRAATLRTLRDRLAKQIDETESGRDVAALSQRLVDVLRQIAELEKQEPAQKGTALDELNARRHARESGAARQA